MKAELGFHTNGKPMITLAPENTIEDFALCVFGTNI